MLWSRVLHHICNDHEYCQHDELEEDKENGKVYLEPNGNTMKELRDIVTNHKWLQSMRYYTNNRHTGMIEVSLQTDRHEHQIFAKH